MQKYVGANAYALTCATPSVSPFITNSNTDFEIGCGACSTNSFSRLRTVFASLTLNFHFKFEDMVLTSHVSTLG
jgi:hypothetical protein